MPFLRFSDTAAPLNPDELELLKRVYDRIAREAWVAKDPDKLDELALLILDFYDRGYRRETELQACCTIAAL